MKNNMTYNESQCYNCTTTVQSHAGPPSEMLITYEMMVQIALHTFIFVGGLLGNGFVATIILRRKQMQTITNWFVFNLALSDIAIVVISLPITNIFPFLNWPFGEIACKYFLYPVLEHFAGVCVLTHTAVGVARYIIVKNAMSGKKLNMKHVKITIAAIWLTAFLIMSATLMGVLGRFKLTFLGTKLQCSLEWVSMETRIVYRVSIFLLTYVIPMVATGFAYYKIHVTVSNSIKHLYGHMSDEVLTSRRRKSRRMNQVLMTMYIMFAVTTLPLQVFYFFNDFGVIPATYGARMTWFLLVALFYAQVVSNPLVLFYMGEDYRKELYRLPVCFCAPHPKFRRMSYVFKGSFKGSARRFKQRKSVGNTKLASEVSDDSKTRLMNGEKRISTPVGSKKSDDTLFIINNGYSSKYNFPNNDDILQTPEYPPYGIDENYSDDQTSIGYHTSESANGGQNTLRNEGLSEGEIDDNASSFLYYSDSQPEYCNDIDRDGAVIMDSTNKNNATVSQSEKSTDCNDQSKERQKLIEDELLNISKLLKENNLENLDSFEDENSQDFMESTRMDKKLSRESITAYYDDGTLLYFYDPAVGKVSFDHDDGRETDI